MRAFLVVATAAAALLAAGCSSRPAPQVQAPSTAARSPGQTQEYFASPAKHFEVQAEARKREAAAARAEARARSGGATATPVSRPPVAARTFPEPSAATFAPAAPATPVAAAPAARPQGPCCPPVYCPPCDPCAGGKCGVPSPFCCDPCAGGKCGIPEPAFDCSGK